MSERPAVLFVCLGNICRSPLAEGALRKVAAERDLAVRIDSAGTGTWHVGNPPDPRSVAEAARHGADIGGQRARQVTPRDFRQFSHIYALDEQNLSDLRAIAPADATARLALLSDAVPGAAGRSVPDPYYGGEDGFRIVWQQVHEAACAIADELSR